MDGYPSGRKGRMQLVAFLTEYCEEFDLDHSEYSASELTDQQTLFLSPKRSFEMFLRESKAASTRRGSASSSSGLLRQPPGRRSAFLA
jgi:hypothetical protein